MATLIVGDVQGCYDELRQLLDLAGFDEKRDELWLTGDLVARGPQSLQTLRFVRSLGRQATTVLGNHDLHLLALAADIKIAKGKDRLSELLEAPDRDELLAWLATRPLLAIHPQHAFVMVHAGIHPAWHLHQAVAYAREVEQVLRGPQQLQLLQQMYGDGPAYWDEALSGAPRWRFIINAFTRMRYCERNTLVMDLAFKGPPTKAPTGQVPWFKLRHGGEPPIIFGHWASLLGQTGEPTIIGLDTGCVWGNQLTLLRWEDRQYFSHSCQKWGED